MVPSAKQSRHTFEGERGEVPFRSPIERNIGVFLEAEGVDWAYEEERLNYTVSRSYTPDFRVGDMLFEVKGWFRPQDRTKLLAVKKQHPGIDLRLIFENPSTKLRKGSSTSYADWCDKYGFPWAGPVGWEKWLND